MKISTRTWVILLFVLILAAAVVLYFMYNNKLEEREQAVNSRNQAELMIPVLQSQKASAEEELTGLKTQYQELLKELENLNTSLGESEDELAGSQARLRLVIESIEYGERLFALASASGVEITTIEISSPVLETITGIDYEATQIQLDLMGQNEDILAFINAIASDEGFATTLIEPVNLTIPPLIEPEPYDIEAIRQKYHQMLLAENLAALSPETMVDIIQDVTRDMFGLEIDDNTMDERISFIATQIAAEFSENLREGLAQSMAEDLATAIEELIADQLAGKVAVVWGAKIAEVLVPVVETILEGEAGDENADIWADMYTWMGEEVEGSIQGNITSIISGYISTEIQQRIALIIEPLASSVEALTQAEVAALEEQAARIPIPDSTVNMTLEIYNFPG